MAVTVTANRPAVVVPPPTSVTITLDIGDAKVLRTMLGGLRRKVRREAVKQNGGNKASANRARHLTKELIDAMDAVGATRLDEVPVSTTAPSITGSQEGAEGGELSEDEEEEDFSTYDAD